MARGDKSAYTGKQKRMAGHIEKSYESRGVSDDEAERRAWATVNKETGGGRKGGSKAGSRVSSSEEHKRRSEAAKKGWQTRRSSSK